METDVMPAPDAAAVSTTISTDARSAPKYRWTEVCPSCGYPLTGLPDSGVCPECGKLYKTSDVILHGWGKGVHAKIWNAKRGHSIRLVAINLTTALFQTAFCLSTPRYRPLGLLFLGAQAIWLVYLLVMRSRIELPGLVQVRLSDRGCVQYDDLDPSANFNRLISYVFVPILAVPLLLLPFYCKGSIEPFVFVLASGACILFGSMLWIAGHRIRHDLAAFDTSEAGDLKLFLTHVTPWSAITSYNLKLVDVDSARLSILRGGLFASRVPVDAEVRCSPEQMKQLKERLKHWVGR